MTTREDVCKVILVGDSGVGKTSIILRFISNEFNKDVPSTSGANYASKDVEFKDLNAKLQYDVWDTAGQEQYKGLSKIFYKDASIVILVFDITNEKSFTEIKEFWYNEIKENSPEDISKIKFFNFLVIAIAGNKSDLFLEEEVNKDDAEEYAKSIGAYYRKTSASTNEGITQLFMELGKKFLNPTYQMRKETLRGRPGTVKLNDKIPTKDKKGKCC